MLQGIPNHQELHPHNEHVAINVKAKRQAQPSFSPRAQTATLRVLMPERLPIYDIERDIIARLKSDRRLILSAPTGSGKSTQVPQMLLQHGLLGDGQVVILQPRRLATRLLAARVAQELGVKLGQEVGYQIRFENVTSAENQNPFRHRRRFAAADD